MKIKLNVSLKGYAKDSIIDIDADTKGNPIDLYWARRLEDSQIDNCIEVITDKKTKNNKE